MKKRTVGFTTLESEKNSCLHMDMYVRESLITVSLGKRLTLFEPFLILDNLYEKIVESEVKN